MRAPSDVVAGFSLRSGPRFGGLRSRDGVNQERRGYAFDRSWRQGRSLKRRAESPEQGVGHDDVGRILSGELLDARGNGDDAPDERELHQIATADQTGNTFAAVQPDPD